jgi:dTDP-4-dehydrorhamnose 3,5-epimerase-like enzyme
MRVVEEHRAWEEPHELLDVGVLGYEDAAVETCVIPDPQMALEVAIGADAHAVTDARPFPDLDAVPALEVVADLDVRVDDRVAANESSAADAGLMKKAERPDDGVLPDDGIRAYDARLVNAGSHRAIIGPTEVPGVSVHRLTSARDERGSLVALELGDCPFAPERIFAVYDVPSESVRGAHAHRACEQFLVCVAGSVKCLVDDGEAQAEVDLEEPSIGLHIPPMVWATQWRYTKDAVLLVLASRPYDAADYIRSYDEFLELASAERRSITGTSAGGDVVSGG